MANRSRKWIVLSDKGRKWQGMEDVRENKAWRAL